MLLSSGQFTFQLPLLSISSLGGVGWGFGLNYLAGNDVDDVLGPNFNFPQFMRLEAVGGGDVDLVSGENTAERFVSTGPGTYEPAPDNNTQATLTRAGSGANDEFTLTASGGNVTKFFGFDIAIDAPGRLKSITDRFGNQQTYTWDHNGGLDQLLTVTDSYGRTVDYSYFDALGPVGSRHKLREIEDFLGRKLNFQYDIDGRLIAVVTPSILAAAEGNAFPNGTAYVFEYRGSGESSSSSESSAEEDRKDDLVRIYYPNEVQGFVSDDRTVDVTGVYQNAIPRYTVTYGTDPLDINFGRVIGERVGSPDGSVGGEYTFSYSASNLPTNFVDPSDPIVFECTVTDRNGNEKVYDFNSADMPVRVEVKRNRDKIDIPSTTTFPSYITYTKYNQHNQPLLVIFPEGNSVEFEYEDGVIPGVSTAQQPYNPRVGLLLRRTRKVDNPFKNDPTNPIPALRDGASNGQTELTQRFFYEPIFNQQTAVIEERGNPIDAVGTYFTPQNGGTTPTNADRSRYATISFCDYQKNQVSTVTGDTDLQNLLGLNATEIQALIDFVDDQMKATDGTGGLPDGFELDLGDINGDGTGDGASSGLDAATILGNGVKVKHPDVRLIGASSITTQVREEIFTTNLRGQQTTHTDPEGNLTVWVRYPDSDPEGDGRFVVPSKGNQQYGRAKMVIRDADPNDVMSLVGSDGDLVDFIPGVITRTNTPGVYRKLTTRYEGTTVGAGGGCASCAYDPLGNPLAQTDPRGFTTHFERNEMGEVYRTISPDPYRYKTEMYYDANRNVIRVDTEDQWVDYDSDDPTSALFAQFAPTGSGNTAQVPSRPGAGGSIRPGWFTDLMSYDLLDNVIEQNRDATGSQPDRLISTNEYDPNENLIKMTKPEGNTVEFDYDERNLQIAVRVGNSPDTPAVSVTAHDGNGNVLQVIGPAARGGSGNHQTVTIEDAFDSGSQLVHTGDFNREITYDGFDRLTEATDAVGNVEQAKYDPGSRTIEVLKRGLIGGATPTNRSGTGNVVLAKSITRFDEAGRKYESQRDVFVANTASSGSLPSGREIVHIGGGLATNSTADDHTAVAAIYKPSGSNEESYVLTRNVFDKADRVVKVIADNTGIAAAAYDGANRRIEVTDAVGNITDLAYDNNSNVTGVKTFEKCTIQGPQTIPDESFRSATLYDSLNRPVLTARQGADGSFDAVLDESLPGVPWVHGRETIIALVGYDSRSNVTLSIDSKGNTAITVFDGASRPTMRQRHLRQKGQGQLPPAEGTSLLPYGGGTVRNTTTAFDGNDREISVIDDNGNVSRYAYDTLDRQTEMIYADSSKRQYAYNEASNVIQFTDQNGSVFANTFDAIGRKTQCDITKATGVLGTTQQKFEYDGVMRLTFCRDSIVADHAHVSLFYDSLSRVLEDSQTFNGNTRSATNEEFTSYPVTRMAFPDGRQIANEYDAMYRRVDVSEGGSSIGSWEFFGPSRVAELTLGNGIICSHLNNDRTRSAAQVAQSSPGWGDDSSDRLGYDGAGRVITKRYLAGGINGTSGAYDDSTAVVGQTTAYDKASNKLYERALQAEPRSNLYEPVDISGGAEGGYDSLDRLRQYQRGVLSDGVSPNPTPPGGSVATPINLQGADESRVYDLDGLGNWRRTTFDPVGASEETQIRQHNSLNQITSTQDEGQSKNDLSYDLNGNLLDDGVRKYEWDALDRLIKVSKTPATPVLIGEYTYDGIGRRIRKFASNGGLSGNATDKTTEFSYLGMQCCQENTVTATYSQLNQYVWGIYIDELIQLYEKKTGGDWASLLYGYLLSDTLYRTIALTDHTGAIIEAYDTDAYGNTLIFTAAGTGGDWWADDATTGDNPICEFIFTGRRYDPETKIYFFRRRYYGPSLARFFSRDPIGNLTNQNLYTYVYSHPTTIVDPLGLQGTGMGYNYDYSNRSYVGEPQTYNSTTMTFTLISEAEFNEDNILPSRTIRSVSLDNMIARIKEELKRRGESCLRKLQIDEHGGVQGQAKIAIDLIIYENDDEILSGEIPMHEQTVNRLKESFKRYRALTDLICDDGILELVQCDAGGGIEGAELKKLLEDQSGNRIRVKLYTGNVSWHSHAWGLFPSYPQQPLFDYLFHPIRSPKRKSS